MMELFKAFFSEENFSYEGGYITEVKYQRFKAISKERVHKNKVIESNKRFCVLNCSGYSENEIVESLEVCFFFNVTVKGINKAEPVKREGILWRNFLKEEVVNFSHLIGDTNSIHLTENPVVQALFILKELCDTTKANEIRIVYTHPVLSNNQVYLKNEGNIINGFSNDTLCFKAEL